MLHEILFVLAGHPGDIFVERDGTFRVTTTDLPYLSPQECTVLNRLGQLGWACHNCRQFIRRHKRTTSVVIENATDTSSTRYQGIYADALCDGLRQMLAIYTDRLVQLETTVLAAQQATSPTGLQKSTTLVTDLLAALAEYELVWPAITQLLVEVDTQPDTWHGVRCVEQLRKRYVSTGVPLLRASWHTLWIACMHVLWRQLTAWAVYGLLQDPYSEFFIRPLTGYGQDVHQLKEGDMAHSSPDRDQDVLPAWRRHHELIPAAIPAWIGPAVADDVLFIGQLVLAVQERGHTIPDHWTQSTLQQWHALATATTCRPSPTPTACASASEFGDDDRQLLSITGGPSQVVARLARTARRRLADWLWRMAVQQYDAVAQLRAFRDYYLLGRGDYFDALVDAVAAAVSTGGMSDRNFRDRELRALWLRAATHTSAEQDRCFEQFRLTRVAERTDTDALGVPANLLYQLAWPFDLVVSPGELARYNSVFLMLLAIRTAQRRLHLMRTRRDVPTDIQRRFWHLRHAMQCFIDHIWAHMQMDVIEVHFQQLCQRLECVSDAMDTEVQPASTSSSSSNHDMHDIQWVHTQFLDEVCKGCFMTMPAVLHAIRKAVRSCIQLSGYLDAKHRQLNHATLQQLEQASH